MSSLSHCRHTFTNADSAPHHDPWRAFDCNLGARARRQLPSEGYGHTDQCTAAWVVVHIPGVVRTGPEPQQEGGRQHIVEAAETLGTLDDSLEAGLGRRVAVAVGRLWKLHDSLLVEPGGGRRLGCPCCCHRRGRYG